MTVSQLTWAGLADAHFAFLNTTLGGVFAGYANLTTTNTGTTSGMRRLKGVQSMPAPSSNKNVARVRGDDNPNFANFIFTAEAPDDVTAMGAVIDLDLNNVLQGTQLFTAGGVDIALGGLSTTIQNNGLILTHSQGVAKDGSGAKGWYNRLYSVSMTPLGLEEQSFQRTDDGQTRYALNFQSFYKTPMGDDVSTEFLASNGLWLEWFSTDLTMLAAKVGDGTATTITLDYAPVSVATTRVTLIDGSGVKTNATVSSVAGKVVTLSAAIPSGSIAVVQYQTKVI